MSKGGSGSSMTQAGRQSSFGGQMPMQQQGYQSPFGNQNYRSQPSQPAFNNYSYQQPGQFGGQIMNQSMRSPGSKGGYSAPVMQQPMRSPGGKGGYQPPMRQQMPSPGGKGRSYQSQQMPSGYGQSTFNPGQFGGYGQPSNMFSFSNPHYQPYVPPVYEPPPPPPPPPPPYRGDDPRGSGVTSSPPSTGSKGGTQRSTEGSGNFGYQDYFSSDAGQEVVKNIRNIIGIPDFNKIDERLSSIESRPAPVAPTIDYDAITDRVRQGINIPQIDYDTITNRVKQGINIPQIDTSGIMSAINSNREAISGIKLPDFSGIESRLGKIENRPLPTIDYDAITDRVRQGINIPQIDYDTITNRVKQGIDIPQIDYDTITNRVKQGINIPFREERVFTPPPLGNNPPPSPDYGFTPPTQPPAPISDQVLTPVMPKPTAPPLKAPKELINPVTTTEEKQQYDQLFGANVSGDGGQLVGIGSLMGPSGLPGRSESFTPPKDPLAILLAERGFQMPEKNQGVKTADMSMHGIDPVTGLMRLGSGSDTEYYRKLDKMYAQNPEALEIAKQYHADQLKKAREGAQGGISDLQTPLKQITYSPNQPVPQRNMNIGPVSFDSPFGRLR